MKKLVKTIMIALAIVMTVPAVADAKTVVTISNKTKTVYVGKSTILAVKRNNKKVTGAKWYSSNKKVATVSKSGTVTGRKAGKCTIIAKYNKKSYKCVVTVKKQPVKIRFNKTRVTMENGKSCAVYMQRNGKNVVVKSVKTSNKKVATVTRKGNKVVIQARHKGTAIITAKYGNKTYKCVVTVTNGKWAQTLHCSELVGKTDRYADSDVVFKTNVRKNQVVNLNYAGKGQKSFTMKYDCSAKIKKIEVANLSGDSYQYVDSYEYNDGNYVYDEQGKRFNGYYECVSVKVDYKKHTVTFSAKKLFFPINDIDIHLIITLSNNKKVFLSNLFIINNTTKGSQWDKEHYYKKDGCTWDKAWKMTVVKQVKPGVTKLEDDYGEVVWTNRKGRSIRARVANIDIGNGKTLTVYGQFMGDFGTDYNNLLKNCKGGDTYKNNGKALMNYVRVAVIEESVADHYGTVRPNGEMRDDDCDFINRMYGLEFMDLAGLEDYKYCAYVGWQRYDENCINEDTTGTLTSSDCATGVFTQAFCCYYAVGDSDDDPNDPMSSAWLRARGYGEN